MSITMNKASGGDGIPVELFQILKDNAVKVLHSISQHIWKTQQWPQDWKRSAIIPIPKKGNAKKCSNYHTIALISHASKVMLNSPSQASTVHELNFQMFKLDLTSVGSSKNERVPEKHLLLLYWLCQSLWLYGPQQTGKFLKRWKYQTTCLASC